MSELTLESTRVAGFRFAGGRAGLKASGAPDLALLVAKEAVPAAAVFTRNRFRAAPVDFSAQAVRGGLLRGLVVNSGNANACTGRAGMDAAKRMAASLARQLGGHREPVAVASTGIIGVPLAVDRVEAALPGVYASLAEDGLPAFARAILTTDRGPKFAATRGKVGGRVATVAGVTKGAGMIAPRMATTLGFVVTDANVSPPLLRRLLRRAADSTFNAVSVDGDTSTNDSLFLLASGAAGGSQVRGPCSAADALSALLEDVCGRLARQLVADGEGATRVIEILVEGAPSRASARRIAEGIARSPLVRTAFHGADPNWGRILAAIGNTGVAIDPHRVDLTIGGVPLVRSGMGVPGDASRRAREQMQKKDVPLHVQLHAGAGSDRYLACDLSAEYIRINSEYST